MDRLAPGLEGYRSQYAAKGLPVDDETVVLFAMFPLQVEALVRRMALTIDGQRHDVSVQKLDA